MFTIGGKCPGQMRANVWLLPRTCLRVPPIISACASERGACPPEGVNTSCASRPPHRGSAATRRMSTDDSPSYVFSTSITARLVFDVFCMYVLKNDALPERFLTRVITVAMHAPSCRRIVIVLLTRAYVTMRNQQCLGKPRWSVCPSQGLTPNVSGRRLSIKVGLRKFRHSRRFGAGVNLLFVICLSQVRVLLKRLTTR